MYYFFSWPGLMLLSTVGTDSGFKKLQDTVAQIPLSRSLGLANTNNKQTYLYRSSDI